jgi:hypothetical protein
MATLHLIKDGQVIQEFRYGNDIGSYINIVEENL